MAGGDSGPRGLARSPLMDVIKPPVTKQYHSPTSGSPGRDQPPGDLAPPF